MTRRATHRLAVTVATLAAATLGLVGCSAQPAPTTTKTVTATASATASSNPSHGTPTATPSRSASSPAATAARIDPNAPEGQCADSALTVTVKYDPNGAGAGQRSSWVIFHNTGSTSCVLAGAPGVSLVGNNDGTQLGQPADRTGDTATPVTIPAGNYAGALLNYTYVDKDGGNFNNGKGGDPGCKAAPADGYRIYPPHSYKAFFDRSPTYACTTNQRWIHVGPVQAAAKVTVKP